MHSFLGVVFNKFKLNHFGVITLEALLRGKNERLMLQGRENSAHYRAKGIVAYFRKHYNTINFGKEEVCHSSL